MSGVASPVAREVVQPVASSVVGDAVGGGDVDAAAFISAAAITDETQIAAIETLVANWKAAGMWNRTVAIYPFVGGTAESHKWNLKDPRDLDVANRLSFSGTITHLANGVDPDGTTGLANTFIDLNEQVPQYSFSCGYYSRDNTQPGSGDYLLFGQNNMWFDLFSGTSLQVALSKQLENSSPAYTTATGMSAWNGLLGFSQNGPSSLSVYRNKTQITNNTNAQFGYWSDSEPAANRHLRLFGTANGPVWAGKTDKECAFFFVSYAVDQVTWNSISDIVTAFQTALGRNV